MAIHELTLPLTDEKVEKLQLGDTVYLTGVVYTARDMAHLEIKKLVQEKKDLPVEFKGSAIFHAGPVLKKRGNTSWNLRVIGPTTSMRMEPYAEMVGQLGVKAIIGKGGMRADSQKAFSKYKQVYLQAAPGCAVKLAGSVESVEGGFWLEKGMPEALWILHVKKFGPFAVTMDCCGNSTYQMIKEQAQAMMKEF